MYKKGVEMTKLVESKVFFHTFDFDEWPGTNADTSRRLEPYNGSIFRLRNHYQSIFPDIYAADE